VGMTRELEVVTGRCRQTFIGRNSQ
jgi:hypothetical protein